MRTPTSHPRDARLAALVLCGLLASCVDLRDWKGEPPQPEPQPELGAVDSREFQLLPEQQMVGGLYSLTLREGDTLPDVARQYGLGYDEIVAANPTVDPWVPAAGTRVLLPLQHVLPQTLREGIVLNLANMRLFYYPDREGREVYTYPAGIGQEGWETPVGRTEVVSKKAKPSWYVPASILKEHEENGDPLPRVVPPGPENPLGDYALRLGMPSYLIHGTNKPYGVGMRVSHGCVRLYPEDIEPLFERVDVGVAVQIVDQPYLLGWQGETPYLEAHAPFEEGESLAEEMKQSLLTRLDEEASQRDVAIDWERVDDVLRRADGIPIPVLAPAPGLAQIIASATAVAHPGQFYGQPALPPLQPDDWSVAVADFDDEATARRLAAMLNHEGPPIPARALPADARFVVVAGPFEDHAGAEAAAARIQRDFEFDARPLPPESASGSLGAPASQ